MACWVVTYIFLILVVANDASGLRPSDETSKPNAPRDKWFNQRLDHFDITNSKMWKQRYHVINDYYQKGGPAFLMVEGLVEATGEDMLNYASIGLAKKLNAMVFQLEHRYYGRSMPTGDLSVANLRYLTADQALVDNAFFIESMISQYELPEGTKWIAFGGSYAGNLAAWLRYKFPHMVYASVAYSAPVLAKLNFYEFRSYVRDTIKRVNKECLNAIIGAHSQVKTALQNSNSRSEFARRFKLCDPVDATNKKDITRLFEVLGDNVAGIFQNSDLDIESLCDIMVNKTIGDYIDRYAKFHSLILENAGEEFWDMKYDPYIDLMKAVSWGSVMAIYGARQWVYQCCTEFGYLQTSYKPTHLFSEDIPLEYYIQQCEDIYGEQFNKKLADHGVKRTNMMYGGKDIKATKVAYVFGNDDPWVPLGITTAHTEAPSILIDGASNNVCLYDSTDSDFEDKCNQIEDIVAQWCKE